MMKTTARAATDLPPEPMIAAAIPLLMPQLSHPDSDGERQVGSQQHPYPHRWPSSSS